MTPTRGQEEARRDENGEQTLRGSDEATYIFRSGSLRQILNAPAATSSAPTPDAGNETGHGPSLVEERGDGHAEHQHRIAIQVAEKESSTMTLPSFSTIDRTDAEGQSLLHRGGTGGLYDSFGAMEDVSGTNDISSAGHSSRGNDDDFFVDDEERPELRTVKFPGVEKDEKMPTSQTPPNRKSRGISFFSNVGGMSASDAPHKDERDQKKRSGWSIMRNRNKSILVRGRRLLLTPDKESLEDESGEESQIRNSPDCGPDHAASGNSEGSRLLSQESLLEKAKEGRKKFELTPGECVLAICVYLGLSVVAFSGIFEQWPVIDSLYFGVVTFTTTGYGDLTPSTDSGRVFCCFYAFGGVAALGLALGVLGENLIESEIRADQTAQNHTIRTIMNVFESADEPGSRQASDSSVKLKKDFCSSPLKYFPALSFLVIGAVFISIVEGWDWSTGLYYTVITMCTIGFGDLTPQFPLARAFGIVFIPLAVALVGALLGKIANVVIEKRHLKFRSELLSFEPTLEALEAMDSSGDGRVSKADYVEFMLLAMDKVDRELINSIHQQFERLDATGSGDLSIDDLKLRLEKNLKSVRKKLELADYKKHLLLQGRGESCGPAKP